MKTDAYIVNKTQWINGRLEQKGAEVNLTKEQAKELAPPFGSAVSKKTTNSEAKKDAANGKFDGDKRARGGKPK